MQLTTLLKVLAWAERKNEEAEALFLWSAEVRDREMRLDRDDFINDASSMSVHRLAPDYSSTKH